MTAKNQDSKGLNNIVVFGVQQMIIWIINQLDGLSIQLIDYYFFSSFTLFNNRTLSTNVPYCQHKDMFVLLKSNLSYQKLDKHFIKI